MEPDALTLTLSLRSNNLADARYSRSPEGWEDAGGDLVSRYGSEYTAQGETVKSLNIVLATTSKLKFKTTAFYVFV